MKTKRLFVTLPVLVVLALVFSTGGCQSSLPTIQTPVQTPSVTSTVTNSSSSFEIPYSLISQESLFGYLEGLTSIQPYSGWRNSASSGEAEALDYIEAKLGKFANLQDEGLELERQGFPVYLSTEIWDAGLVLTVDGREIPVPTEGLRGNRFDRHLAAYFDSDGAVNDSDPDPMTAGGSPLIVGDEDEFYSLTGNQLKGRILFLDYSLIDRATTTEASDGSRLGADDNRNRLLEMVDQGLAGMVLVAHFSNKSGESHSMGVSEGSAFGWQIPSRRIPILFVRIEDLSPAGIADWGDLERIESAQLTLDADVFSPGRSGNVIARIPGEDSSKAVILGAHIDSPNNPGALDDGSGSAALLEIARVLDASRVQPPVDVYLAWFGSEELGIYGSSFFVTTHQDLLDRTLAMVQMDCLGLPLDGRTSQITMVLASYDRFGDERLLLPDFLSNAVTAQGVSLDRYIEYGVDSDHNNFEAFNVPNIDLLYLNKSDLENGSRPIHYYNHWHEPYETADRVRAVGDVFVDMTKVLLAAALEIGRLQPELRVTPVQTRRALIVASHTESFGITVLRELGTALSWEGFDVDLIPYGQTVTPGDLENVGIIVLPPALNSPGSSPEVWSESEIAALRGYVEDGGLLVVINSANGYASTLNLSSPNLSARSANALLEPMGIKFMFGGLGSDDSAVAVSDHPLTSNATYLTLQGGNTVAFSMKNGQALFHAVSRRPLVGLVDYGEQGGQILVIAEMGLVQTSTGGAKNIQFVINIAHYASTR